MRSNVGINDFLRVCTGKLGVYAESGVTVTSSCGVVSMRLKVLKPIAITGEE